jgi:hypothetical protein
MAQLTPAQYAAKLRSRMKQLQEGEPLRIAAQTVHAMRVERIFDTGTVARGYNKTKELWVDDSNLRSNGSHRGKTGKSIKTTYFSSYFALKGQQGFDNSKVNFRLTNDLQMDFANSTLDPGTGKAGVGTPIKKSNTLFVEALRRSDNQDKLKGLKAKFGDFTIFYQNERDTFFKVIKFETFKLLNG